MRPTYDEVAWRDYCAKLRADGHFDTPNGDCRRLYYEEQAREDEYQDEVQDHEEAKERRRALANMFRGAGGRSVTCRSHTDRDGDLVTECN